MSTRNAVLTDQQAEFIEKLVQSGRYQNTSGVIRGGLRFLQRREREADSRYRRSRASSARYCDTVAQHSAIRRAYVI
ncbi:MAG: type II toxin-antitoxin system ParD family antitoxin [Gammaproteobacteria bacterium]|nr:type II toxin-antitoxin system ParD family antitoxin [Gammaproteobacteria bacterium]